MVDTIQSDEKFGRIKGRYLEMELKLHQKCLQLIPQGQRMNEQKVLHTKAIPK